MQLLFIFLNIALTAVLPLAILAALLIRKKWRPFAKPYLLGAATMLVFQFITRIPLLQLLAGTTGFIVFSATNPVLYLALLALTAGLFEEAGRHIMMSLFLKNRTAWADGVLFGLGHGFLEALLLVGVNYAVAMLLMPMPLLTASPALLLLAGLERLLTLVWHTGFSLLVLHGVKTKKRWPLPAAIAAHALLDFTMVPLLAGSLPYWASYGIFALITLPVLGGILYIKKRWTPKAEGVSHEENT